MSKETVLDKNAFLVSETDAKGIIKFANEDFCKIAGYSLEELVGKPHNVVRHPDMPKYLDRICKKCHKRWWILLGFCNSLSF